MSFRRIMASRPLALAALMILGAAAAPQARAVDFSYSGFGSLTVGDMLGGTHRQYLGYQCPCYISNYEYNGMYEDHGLSAKQESLFGLQGTAKFTDAFSGTVQAVARGQTGSATVDWAYLTYDVNSAWTVQAGRKRLPLYVYSDNNYIGYAYVWVRPPVDLYGWEIFDYDGANVMYHGKLGSWALVGNAYAGSRSTTNNQGQRVYYDYRLDEAWRKIVGGYLDLSNDVYDLRVVYQHNTMDETSYEGGVPTVVMHDMPQTIIGTAFNIDYNNLLVRLEANMFSRPAIDFKAIESMEGVGYRFGSVTTMVTHSSYFEKLTPGYTAPQRTSTNALTLRWDFAPSWDFKVQYDDYHDHSVGDWFIGSSRMLSMSVNTIF